MKETQTMGEGFGDGKKTSGAGVKRRSPPPKYGDLSTLVGIG